MKKVPSLSCVRVVHSLQKDGWIVVRQKGSHVRVQKRIGNETLKITVPANRQIKISTLAHILKQAKLPIDKFLKLL